PLRGEVPRRQHQQGPARQHQEPAATGHPSEQGEEHRATVYVRPGRRVRPAAGAGFKGPLFRRGETAVPAAFRTSSGRRLRASRRVYPGGEDGGDKPSPLAPPRPHFFSSSGGYVLRASASTLAKSSGGASKPVSRNVVRMVCPRSDLLAFSSPSWKRFRVA